jgi:hypothetical protein
MKAMRTYWTVCPYAAALLIFAQVSGAAEYEQNIEKSFKATPGGELKLEADQGSVQVTTDQQDDVRIRVFRKVSGGSKENADGQFANHIVAISQEGNNVIIVAKTKTSARQFWSFNKPWMDVRYEIDIPTRFNVSLKTAGGNVTVGNLDGAAVAKTASGTINFGKVSGEIDASDAGGDIRVEDAGRGIKASTTSGSIHVGNSGGDTLLKDAGGDIELNHAEGSVSVETTSGSIRIDFAKGEVKARDAGGNINLGTARGDLTAQTTSGTIKVKSARGKLEIKNAGGDVLVENTSQEARISTASGRIRVGKAGGPTDLTDAGGSIEVISACDSVHARTASGDVKVNFSRAPRNGSRLEALGGGIRVLLPRGAGVDLDATALGGNVAADVPLAITVHGEQGRNGLKGKINGGGPELLLHSTSGDVHLVESMPEKSDAEAENR